MIRKEALWKNDLNFVKDVLLKYVRFIINIITLLQFRPSYLLKLIYFLLYYANRKNKFRLRSMKEICP